MNKSLFTDKKTGELFPIKVYMQDDVAFVPHPLPPKWEFPNRLWPLLVKARAVLGRLDGIGQTLRDPQLLLAPLRQREAITSSALEGTYATPQELMLFELNPTKPRSDSDKTNEWQEVANYNQALREGYFALDTTPFCNRLFKTLHGTLLSSVRARYTSPGEFRQHQVATGSDRRYVPPPVNYVEKCMSDLELFINSADETFDPLIKAYLVHYQFEAIHPFYDGNGRIGRVLLSLMTSRWCGFVCPWLYMSAYFEKFKEEYIRKMFRVSTDGAWEEWIEFCLNGTIHQAEDAIRRCGLLGSLRTDMMNRIGANGSPRSHQIVSDLFSTPMIRISKLRRKLGVSYPTAKDDVEKLVKANILVPLEGVRPMAYFAPEIFAVAYGDEHLLSEKT